LSNFINLVASCDNNYAPYIGIVLQSILSNCSQPERIQLYLIDNGISEENIHLIHQTALPFCANVKFVKARKDLFEGLPTKRYGIATYQRLALADILPTHVKRVIYLDSDIIVLHDIHELWREVQSIEGIAAVENFSARPTNTLAIDRAGYFNAGILGINLDFWRTHDIKNKLISFLRSDAHIIHLDQCALNHVFKERWHRLDLKWNVQADIFGVLKKYYDNKCGYTKQELMHASQNPAIVHFIGTQKPWLWNCYSPYKHLFEKYSKQSAWRDKPKPDDSAVNRLKYYFAAKKQFRKQRLAKTVRVAK
jgi:lipopolysaccharide biosynthesis glycosyltransferase